MQRCARGAVVFALATGLLVTPLTDFAPAHAVIDDADGDGTVELSVTAGMHAVVQPDSAVSTVIRIENGSEDDIDAGQVSVEIDRTPLADSAAISSWFDTGAAAGTFSALGVEQTDAIPASETATVSVHAAPTVVGTLADGVYPLRATFTSDDLSSADADSDAAPGTDSDADADADSTVVIADSVLIVESNTSRQLTVLVPITATPADGALLTADELTVLTAPDGALTAQLDGVAGTSAVLAVDPLIPAAIRVLGSRAPHDAIEWLHRFETLSNERFALQAADADATVQARAGLEALLEPLSFSAYLDPADFIDLLVPTPTSTSTPTSSPSPSPSPSAEPTPATAELPDDDELLSIRSATDGILWPLSDVQTADLSVFSAFLEGDATTILPSTSISGVTGAVAEIDGARLLITDAAASASLSNAAAEDDEFDRERAISVALAEMSLSASDTVLVGLDRDEDRTADALRETILSLSAVADTVALESLRSTAASSATLTATDGDDRAGSLVAMLTEETQLTAFASILDEPLLLRAPERLEIMRLIAVSAPESFAEDVASHHAETATTLDAVGVQQPSPIQLFTAAAPLPVWVRNDLPWPVNLTLTSIPSDARLDVQPRTPVVVQPNSNERVKVPVEARVGSGELSVGFSLTSPTGVHIGADQTANVTVRAEWEGIGLGILGSVIGLLLVLGIIRTIVRRRKASRSDAGSSASDAEADATAEQDTDD